MQPVREELEGRGEIPHVSTRTDSLGREQPCESSGDRGEQADLDTISVPPVHVRRRCVST